jgi:hypothetical protein
VRDQQARPGQRGEQARGRELQEGPAVVTCHGSGASCAGVTDGRERIRWAVQ